ncbi:hypothetical protein [Wolbachia endosymbiont (group A) of Pherbina coryleti]|uniref:hypothetical protein n=1 Tax=Wolbachia endosymbiont (group A) of Pherbina coryleti TaxID=3066153 RepID=UPI003132E6A1
MLLACYSHKHISYRIRTIIRKAITTCNSKSFVGIIGSTRLSEIYEAGKTCKEVFSTTSGTPLLAAS